MHKIGKEHDGVVLICHDCSHVELVDSFTGTLSSPRMQAARAMQTHCRKEHGADQC